MRKRGIPYRARVLIICLLVVLMIVSFVSAGFFSDFLDKINKKSITGNVIANDCTDVVALYHFDGNADDDSGNNNNGSLVGGLICNTAGLVGNACSFDGDDDYVQLSSNLGALSDFTITGWIRMNSNASTEQNGNNPFWAKGGNRILINPSSNYFDLNGIIGGPNTDSNIDVWVHIVITREGSTAKYYRNGTNLYTWDIGLNSIDFSSSLIGNQGSYFFNGLIDEFTIYDKALSQTEVSELYNSGDGVSVSCGSACVPDCSGKSCGDDDGCEGLCTVQDCVNVGETCVAGVCVPAPICGDNAINIGEDCDGTNLGGDDCTTIGQGFTEGDLFCYAPGHAQECSFDNSSCTTTTLDCSNDDADFDGWNATALCNYNGVADCDDFNANVNPGAVEVCGNGLDDDCNSGTSDVCGAGTTHYAASCSFADVNAAYNLASNGDTIMVPTGNCDTSNSWSSTLVITKEITIQGAGADKTSIGIPFGNTALYIKADNVEITGIRFDCNYMNTGSSGIINIGSESACQDESPKYSDWRIHHNTFDNCGASGGYVTGYSAIGIEGYMTGLIDNNIFNDCNGECIAPVSDCVGSRTRSLAFGQYDTGFIFIEDNTFNENRNVEYQNLVDSNSGSRWVFRHNNIILSNNARNSCPGCGLTSSHELCYRGNGGDACGDTGDLVSEIYNNIVTINSGSHLEAFATHRSGNALIYNNTIINNGGFGQMVTLSHYRSYSRDACEGAANPRGYSRWCHNYEAGKISEGITFSKTTLNGALGDNTGCPTVASIVDFPTYGGSIMIGSEQIDYSGISENTLTPCIRGANTGRTYSNAGPRTAHNDGAQINLLIFGQCLEQLNNTYIWGNTVNSGSDNSIFMCDDDCGGNIVDSSVPDYTVYDIQSFAQRPQNWQYRNDGTAYDYTPLVYPHPLRNEGEPPTPIHPADTDNSGCVDLTELDVYIQRWFSGEVGVTIELVAQAIDAGDSC